MTSHRPLPFDAPLVDYERQAAELLAAHRARVPAAIELFHRHHPRFLDAKIPWLPKDLPEGEVAGTVLELDDARLTLARCYDFADWQALAELVAAVLRGDGVFCFESAVEAVIDGDLAGLERLLRADPELVRARSTRRTHHDPPEHRATLLHYVAANGVEGYRQRTPPNAPAIARTLLAAGAEPDALAGFYGCECATMSLLVSSSVPAGAGVQGELVEVLLDHGAALEGKGERWGSPLQTALAFGCPDAAAALVKRGAAVDTLPVAAGLGRVADAQRLLASADAPSRHFALALAAQLGHADVVRLLLDAGEDPDRYNPEGAHSHATPLHHAVMGDHMDVVRLLVDHGARLDQEDRIYKSTPLGWASYGGRKKIEAYLRSKGAR